MKSITALVPVEWQTCRILTTAQLAEFYECETRQIKQNFNNNKERFVEGKHYFKLEGADLAAFKASLVTIGDTQKLQATDFDPQKLQVDNFDPQKLSATKSGPYISSMTRVLYLWTNRGAARHAKMLSTDMAWEVFEELEDNYFNPKPVVVADPKPVVKLPERKSYAIFEGYACVYALLMSDSTVKIGYSTNPCPRVTEIQSKSKLTVEKIYISLFVPCKVARFIEWNCKKIFSTQCTKGEFFDVPFAEMCAAIDESVAVFALPFAEKHNIIITNLIADKKFD